MKKLILMIMLVFVTMFSFSFSAYGAGQNNKDYTLTSFENKEDLHRIMFHNVYNGFLELVSYGDCVTDGGYALEVIYNGAPHIPSSFGEPSIRFYNMNNEFTRFFPSSFNIFDYSSMEFDITNYGNAFNFRVNIANARNAKTYDYFTVAKNEQKHVTVSISPDKLNAVMMQENFGTLFYIAIAWDKPQPNQEALRFYLDNIVFKA